ncbi:MAG: methyltransferase domain-containing protein [Tepidisphaera sp.]|nr:methyltransferase domain-containing protein [Tepidisphaera sp.]
MSHPQPLRLHIGGETIKPGWKIVNIKQLPGVDYIGSATDLSAFPANSADAIYGSHIYEHLDYMTEVLKAFKEAHRVLKPGGAFLIAVPDLEALARLFLDPALDSGQRFYVMRMIYGGQTDPWDYHKVGYSLDILANFLGSAGFEYLERVESFGLFNDTSELTIANQRLSLNVRTFKPGADPIPV